jgi:hypothetical protein
MYRCKSLIHNVQSCVVPLSKIIIREKGDTKDSRGLYVICRSRVEPEMYEVVCQTAEQRKTWATVIREAGHTCVDDGRYQNSCR